MASVEWVHDPDVEMPKLLMDELPKERLMPPDESPIDPLPGLLADLDQALAMAGQIARLVKGHFDAFVEEGFTEKQALYLAIAHVSGGPGEPPA